VNRAATRRVAVTLLTALTVIACAPRTEQSPTASTSGIHEFEGSWNAAGTRRIVRFGTSRSSSIVELKGTMLLSGQGRPGVGFLAEAIAFVDSTSGLIGRSVWTDENGDQVFSELEGEGTAATNRVRGIIVGGTGRFEGASGAYEFSWQYLLEAEEGSVQGRAVGLKGYVQIGKPAAGGQP
jgi:hypothetical protein